jgi:para-aminobenzoate synthetase/4-amino-4-deoxychorismate lyase
MIEQNNIVLNTGEGWMHYSNPYRVILVEQLRDVLPALREIEDRVNWDGWHAAGFLSYESAPAFDEAHRTKPALDSSPVVWVLP